MILREWKASCPVELSEGFIEYLHETGVKDASKVDGYIGMQILERNVENTTEITLLTYWENIESIKAFAGDDIESAKLYPEDEKFKLKPDNYVKHYTVREYSALSDH